jgi:hypothetical protein
MAVACAVLVLLRAVVGHDASALPRPTDHAECTQGTAPASTGTEPVLTVSNR